jgi:hypothetical protein
MTREPNAFIPCDLGERVPKMVPKRGDSKYPIGSEGPLYLIILVLRRRGKEGKLRLNFHKFQRLGDRKSPMGIPDDSSNPSVTRKPRVIEYSSIKLICKRTQGVPIVEP